MMTNDQIIAALIAICGEKYVLTSDADTAPYLTDWRGDYQGKARAILLPASTQEVAEIIAIADEHHIPVVPQGGNTSLCGGATPDAGGTAMVISTARMNKIRHLDLQSQTITVDAGCILEHIHQAAEKEGMLFPLNFGARGTCQIGGNLSTNAGGLNVVRYGNTRQLCLGLEIVTPQGKVMDLLSPLKKDNTGYDLKDLFIGAEGTLGMITGATLQLFPALTATATAWAGVTDINAAIALLHRTQSASGGNVVAFELMPKSIIDNVQRHFPDTISPLEEVPQFSCLIEISSTASDANIPQADGSLPLQQVIETCLMAAMEDGLVLDATIAKNSSQQHALWEIRERTPESEIKAGKAYKSDISIPLKHMADFYQRAATAVDKIVPGVKIFGFGHLGDGNLHYNLSTPEEGHPDFPSFYPQFDAVLMGLLKEYGGSISAEHGIGQKKKEMLASVKDPVALAVMRSVKAALDPKCIMNPGKII